MVVASKEQRTKRLEEFKVECDVFLQNFFDTGLDSSILLEFLRKHEEDSEYFDLFIVKVIRKAFDSNELWVIESIAGLFVVAVSAGLVTKHVVSRAFEKFFHLIDDLAMDVPGIYDTVVELISTGIDDNILPEEYLFRTPVNVLKSLINDQRRNSVKDTVDAMEKFRNEVKRFLTAPASDFWNMGFDDANEELRIFVDTQLEEGQALKHELIRPLITTAMTKSNTSREMVSQLLASCTGTRDALFTGEDILLGFTRIFLHLADTKLDILNVQNLIAKFLARAIVDEILPPSFLTWGQRIHLGGIEGMEVLDLVEDWIDPETRKNLGMKYENIWRGSDPLSEVARECRKMTRVAVNELYDSDNRVIAETVEQIQSNALTPDLGTVCVRVIIESLLERDLEERIVAIAVALLQKLKAVHEIDGSNIRDAILVLKTPERLAELEKDVGSVAVQNLATVEKIIEHEQLDRN